MGWSFGVLGLALMLGALGLVMNRSGRKSDREKVGRGN
jgi:hypothetical protein